MHIDRGNLLYFKTGTIYILKSYKIVNKNNTRIIRGAGVDTHLFSPKKQKSANIPIVLLPARMLWDKGVNEFVNCAINIKKKKINVRFVLVGSPDNHNPESISYDQLKKWDNHGVIEWWDYRDDMHTVYQMAQLVCLPSYSEGLPKSLLEAASCEIPIVAFDVPGCREIVIDGINGILVPFKMISFCKAVER